LSSERGIYLTRRHSKALDHIISTVRLYRGRESKNDIYEDNEISTIIKESC
jgi:hypothetical protein